MELDWLTDGWITYVREFTVKPPIVDPPRKGHCIINLSTEDSSWDPKFCFPIVAIQFEPPRRGQPLYKGQSM